MAGHDGVAAGHPVTPDGRYFVVRGRLWRMVDPRINDEKRQELAEALVTARRAVGMALKAHDKEAERRAREKVDAVKRRLGERGPVWWEDGTPDLNRHMARNPLMPAGMQD